jgi:multiple sugar transport system ATP-binding protein
MSVKNNLAFGLKRRSVSRPEIEHRVTAVAGTLGLSGLLDRKPHALSGGQRQRVALGRAIVRDPKVFLFDEPLSNLDAALRVSTRGEIAKLHRRLGATMIYVTHDQVEAMTLGNRICIMNRGRVVQVGAPLEVYRQPANTFVAGFLGNPPMNLLPAMGTGANGGLAVKLGETAIELPASRCPPIREGRAVILGIRPENVSNHPNNGRPAATLEAEIVQVEPLGAETIVAARVAGLERDVMARIGADSELSLGLHCTLALDLSAVHVFDASGNVLVSEAQGGIPPTTQKS